MSEPQAGAKSSQQRDDGESRPKSLQWGSIVMFCFSIILGICCLFFMSIGGVTLCVIHCVIGCLFAAVTLWAYYTDDRAVQIVAAAFNICGLILLFCTFVYAAWQLGQNSKAKDEAHNESFSPYIGELLDQVYLPHAFGAVRRLEATDLLLPSGAEAQENVEGVQHVASVFPGSGDVGGLPAASQLSFTSEEEGREGQSQRRDFEKPLEDETDTEEYEDREAGLPEVESGSRVTINGEGHPLSQKLLDLAVEASRKKANYEAGLPGEQTLLQSQVIIPPVRNAAEQKCIIQYGTDAEFAKKTINLTRALLDRRLFCGYTRYRASIFNKWPLSCELNCYFDGLNFSRHKHNAEKTKEKYDRFVKDVLAMPQEEAALCYGLLLVTGCRIQEKHFQRGVLAALSLALIFCFFMFILQVYLTISCFKVANKEGQSSSSSADAQGGAARGGRSSSSQIA